MKADQLLFTVAAVIEYMRQQGLRADEIKRAFSPAAVDAWFALKEANNG